MVKITDISKIPQVITFSATKLSVETSESLTNSATELSKTASKAITSMQKGLLSVKGRPSLNLDSEAVKFFGLRSYRDMALTPGEDTLNKLKIEKLGCKSFFPESARDGFRRGDSSLLTLFEELDPDCGCARMTFFDECFCGALHTIGFVRNKDTMYVLDSLGHNAETTLGVKDFHVLIEKLLSANMHNSGLKKVVINHNAQQSMNEITCNHWTFANIEALTNSLKSGKAIEDAKTLDSILPNDINKVLDEQLDYVLNDLRT